MEFLRLALVNILVAQLAFAPSLLLAQEREPAAVSKPASPPRDWGKVTRNLVRQSQGHKALRPLPQVWRERWSVEKSDLFLPTGEKGRSEFFTRYLSDGIYYLSIGQVQFSEVPRKLKPGQKKSEEAQEIAAQIQKILVGDWEKRERSGVYIYETLIPKQNRVYRLWIEPQDAVFRVSMSSFRPVHMMPLLLESEMVHRALHTPDGKAVAAHWDAQDRGIAGLLRQFQNFAHQTLLPEALAQGVGGMPFSGMNVPTGQILGGLQGVGASLERSLEGYQPIASRFLDRTSGQIQQGIDLGRDALGTANRGVRAVEDATRQAGDSTRVFDRESQAWRQESAAWRQQGDRALNESEAWRREFRRVSSLENVFMTGFVAASGAALGALAVNAVVSVAGTAMTSLYYTLSGTLPPDVARRLNEQGRQALTDLNQLSERMVEAEVRLDRQLAALVWASGKDPNELAIGEARLRRSILLYEAEIRQMENRMAAMDVSNPRFQQCILDLDQRKQEKAALEGILRTLREVGMDGRGGVSQQRICMEIQRQLNQWINIEGALHRAASTFMGSVRVVMGSLQGEVNASQTRSGSGWQQNNECFRRSLDFDARSMGDAQLARLHAENVAQIRELCDRTDRNIRASDSDQNMVMAGGYLANQLRTLEEQTRELSQSFCAEDQMSGNCDGRSGKFRELVDRWNAKLSLAVQHCPNLASLTQRRLPRDSDATPASIQGGRNYEVQDSNRPDFLGRAWSFMGRAFDWAFGWIG